MGEERRCEGGGGAREELWARAQAARGLAQLVRHFEGRIAAHAAEL